MTLPPRCPACGTIFRVVQDQLKVSEGWVRCGQCHEVFHGIEALFDLDSDPAVAARRAAARGPAAPPPTRVFADQRASAPIPMPTQAPAAPRPAAPSSPIAIPARPATAAPTPPSRFGETGPPSQAPAPVARPGYTGFTPATRPLPPAPARPAPFTAPPAPLSPPPGSPPAAALPPPAAPLPSPPTPAPTPATFSPVATRGTIAPRFAARLAEEAARAQAATAAPTPALFTSTPVTPPPPPQAPTADAFGSALAQQPAVSSWQTPSTPAAPPPEPMASPDAVPTEFVVVDETPLAPAPALAEPAPAVSTPPATSAPAPQAEAPALPAFAPTPLPPPPAPSAPDLPPPPSFLMAKPAPVAAPAPTPAPEAPAMYIPPSLLARPPVMAPPEPVVEPVPEPTPEPERAQTPLVTPLVTPIAESTPPAPALAPVAPPDDAAARAAAFAAPIEAAAPAPVSASSAAAELPEPPRAAAPIIVREPTLDVGGSTLPSMLADDAADEDRAGPPTLASMLPEDAGEWPPKRGRNKPGDPNATESQLVDRTKDPRFLREAKSGARWRKPWVRAVLSVMALALMATALGQVAWPQRDTLAARWPATLPAWQWLCEQAGCSIEPPRAIASLTLEGATLNRTDTEHVLLFAADLHNHSSHEVRVPSFDVTFMDLNGEIVSRKVLTPEDLGIHQVALAGEVELHVHARLQMGTQAASGFQAEMFYP